MRGIDWRVKPEKRSEAGGNSCSSRKVGVDRDLKANVKEKKEAQKQDAKKRQGAGSPRSHGERSSTAHGPSRASGLRPSKNAAAFGVASEQLRLQCLDGSMDGQIMFEDRHVTRRTWSVIGKASDPLRRA